VKLLQVDPEHLWCKATDGSLKGDNIHKGTELIFLKTNEEMKRHFDKYHQFNLATVYAVKVNETDILLRHLQLLKHFVILIPHNERYQPQILDLNNVSFSVLGELLYILDNTLDDTETIQ